MAEVIQKKFQAEVEKYKQLQKGKWPNLGQGRNSGRYLSS